MNKEQMQQIRDALFNGTIAAVNTDEDVAMYQNALAILDAELAKPEQEPVGHIIKAIRPSRYGHPELTADVAVVDFTRAPAGSLLYTAPVPAPEQEPFAWATFDGEGSYDLRLYENNENYLDEYRKMNGVKYAGWVIPLYTAPVAAPQREYGRPMVIGELTKLAEGHSHCFEVPDTLPEGKYEIVLRAALKERGE